MYDIPGIYFTFIAIIITYVTLIYICWQIGGGIGGVIGKRICKYLDKKQIKACKSERTDLTAELQKRIDAYDQDETFSIFFHSDLNMILAGRIHYLDQLIKAINSSYIPEPYMPAGSSITFV